MNNFARKNCYTPTQEELEFVQGLDVSKLPRIACVVPSFNQGDFLADTLDSILNQNYPALEIFVADGGSSDNSAAILADYAQRYQDVLRYDSAPDGGHHLGVNKAIDNTTGDIIAWINSDDIYVPMAFWNIACFFYFNRCALVVYGKSEYVTPSLEKICDYPVEWTPDQEELRRMMQHRCIIPQPSLFFRRAAVEMAGKLLSRSVVDYELWMRWLKKIPFYYCDVLLSKAKVYKNSISAQANTTLLTNICQEVHHYYQGVPLSWCLAMAHNIAYGAAWARWESPPMTRLIRLHGVFLFIKLNMRWLPRTINKEIESFFKFMREMVRGRV